MTGKPVWFIADGAGGSFAFGAVVGTEHHGYDLQEYAQFIVIQSKFAAHSFSLAQRLHAALRSMHANVGLDVTGVGVLGGAEIMQRPQLTGQRS
jgi:hypothetical protein